MTCRVENGFTYQQDYNVDNQLIRVFKMNGSCATGTILETTSFLYDGNRVSQTINGVTTYFVGNYYEYTSTGTVTKYYLRDY